VSETAAQTPSEPISAKRRQILTGAREVFTELGFERASVDLIASRAGVSKATVYHHYADKKSLFVACVATDTDGMRAELRLCLESPAGELDEVLQLVGEKVMAVLLSPPVVALHRHVIAEAARFPDLARTIFDRGPRLIHDAVASHLARWDRSGALRIEDPQTAAIHFLGLCQGDLLARARLGLIEYPVDDEVREAVRRGVRTFLRAHRP
jgi:AcrR family transcriptional regulator